MAKYKFRYWYEWAAGGDCLWAANAAANEKYGYQPCIRDLPLSEELVDFLQETARLHDLSLNWDYPPDPPDPAVWTPEQEAAFVRRAKEGYDRICAELGGDYAIEFAAVP